jgi:hypothetical protein
MIQIQKILQLKIQMIQMILNLSTNALVTTNQKSGAHHQSNLSISKCQPLANISITLKVKTESTFALFGTSSSTRDTPIVKCSRKIPRHRLPCAR